MFTFNPFFSVTIIYWALMLTDGALRMLILLHLHQQGYSPFTLAYIFLLYEFMGILTNFTAGRLGKRFGLSTLLITGICLQTVSLLTLGLIPTQVETASTIILLIIFQGICGIAKDLTKIGSKTATKFLSNSEKGGNLFTNISWLTGSKNSVKGLGFFLGATLISFLSFSTCLFILSALLFFFLCMFLKSILISDVLSNKSNKSGKVAAISANLQINKLSVSRVFLFGARDIWFVIGVPIFLLEAFSTNYFGDVSSDARFFLVGGFLATWVVFYGFMQSRVPRFIRQNAIKPIEKIAFRWSIVLIFPTLVLSIISLTFDKSVALIDIVIVVTFLFIFGVFFAINSSIHSYLILKLTKKENASENVGFYYSANALGRFIGTLLSGITFQLGGLFLCLFITTLFLIASSFFIKSLSKERQELEFS